MALEAARVADVTGNFNRARAIALEQSAKSGLETVKVYRAVLTERVRFA